MSTKKQDYTVSVTVNLMTDVSVKASSFEDALQQAAAMGVRDVVEFDGGFNDGSIEVTGVFK